MNRKRTITNRAMLLTLVLLAVYLPAATAAGVWAGAAGVFDCSAAATACLLGALVALCISRLMRGSLAALMGAMLGMAARMAIPLTVAAAFAFASPPDPVPLYWLLFFYPVALTAEIWLSLERGCLQWT